MALAERLHREMNCRTKPLCGGRQTGTEAAQDRKLGTGGPFVAEYFLATHKPLTIW